MKEWFEEWFDTGYYNELYSLRNEDEADRFIELLVKNLNLKPGSKILDVACGNGRHSIALNELHFDVTGIDLSFQKIRDILSFQNEQLHFYRHDMRHLFRINYFDCVFNFFTSFGYFDSHHDEKNVAHSMSANLVPDGHLVIDYLNTEYVKKHLKSKDEIQTESFRFVIEKTLEPDRISKKITVYDKEESKTYYEKVWLYPYAKMIDLFSAYSLQLEETYGSYKLDPYDELNSERMILIFRKVKQG
jgi:SAM-dependent methyltransferase